MELQHTPHLGATILPHSHHRARMAHASRGAAAWLLCLLALRDGDALEAARALQTRLRGRPHKQ